MRRLKVRRWHVLLLIIIVTTISYAGNRFGAGTTDKPANTEPIIMQSAKPSVAAAEQEPDSAEAIVQIKQATPMKTQPEIVAAANKAQKTFYQNKVAVLTYHHLDPVESSITITPERFASHLEALKNNGFHVISVEDFIDFLQKKKSVPPNAVVLTFDDGYESVYKYAYPILKSEGMTATVFLIVSYIEDGTLRQPPILNWKEIMEMHSGGISFYSHSYNSHDTVIKNGKELSMLTTNLLKKPGGQFETDNEYRARIRSDLTMADNILNDKLGNKLNLLCLPHGQFNQTVIDVANESHISYLFTGMEGFNTDKIKLIKRMNAGSPYMSDRLLIKKLSLGK